MIDPFQAHVDAINAGGLRMLEGDAETVVKVSACTSANQAGIVADLVIVLVKSYHTRCDPGGRADHRAADGRDVASKRAWSRGHSFGGSWS